MSAKINTQVQDSYDLTSLLSQKKKRKNSRTKGNTFERKVAGMLNERFGTTEFMRSPGSGAFSSTHNLPDHLKFSGDLITPKSFTFTIECKKGYNKENIGSLFDQKSDTLSFIQQAKEDASRIKKNFLVIFQQDRKSILCIFDDNAHPTISHFMGNRYRFVKLKNADETYVICKLEDLLTVTKEYPLNTIWGI